MSARRSGVALLAAATVLLSGCVAARSGPATRTSSGVVRVAAASDLTFALEELRSTFERSHPGIDVKVSYGSSGTFLQQISNGAPFDLYLSADLSYPEHLVTKGLAAAADVFPYAVGRLVVWTPEGSTVDPAGGLAVLARRDIAKVAIANPEHAPYGRAAVAAMKTAGVYDGVAPKLVLGENVAQAADFVRSGGADAGVVAMSLVLSDPLRGQGRWAEVSLADYPRLEQGGVVLARAANLDAARALRDAMLSDEGRALLKRYGFFLPDA